MRKDCSLADWTRLSCHRFRANEVRLLLGVIAYNLGNLLRRLVLPVAIQSWSLTSLQQRLFQDGRPAHSARSVLRPSQLISRKLLDREPLSADPWAHRAFRPPIRLLPLKRAPADESNAMREDWVSWFGIPTQFSPHWDGPPIDEPTYHTRLIGE